MPAVYILLTIWKKDIPKHAMNSGKWDEGREKVHDTSSVISMQVLQVQFHIALEPAALVVPDTEIVKLSPGWIML